MGYAGRNSETELSGWAGVRFQSKRLGHRRLLSRLSGCLLVRSAQSVVRPRAGFRTSPKRVLLLKLGKMARFAFRAFGL